MRVNGIIAEYNPFHNGHLYQLKQSKEATGSDYTIVVMSGNFTQRGDVAFCEKHVRTRMALQNGADLVIAAGCLCRLQCLGVCVWRDFNFEQSGSCRHGVLRKRVR